MKETKKYKNYNFKFLFVNNSSTDNTLAILEGIAKKNKSVSVITYSKNFGYMKSLYTGIINCNSDACVNFDCDLQDPPSLLLDFIKQWEMGFDFSYGIRSLRDESFLMFFLRKCFRKIEFLFKGYEIKLETGVWFISKKVIDELKKSGYDPYLPGLISRLGFLSIGVTYNRKKRLYGQSKANYPHYFSYAFDGLLSNTLTPLRLILVFGTLLSFFSFFLLSYFIYLKFFSDIQFETGVVAISVIMLFGFGVNFIFIGIIGEYLGRTYLKDQIKETAIIKSKINI